MNKEKKDLKPKILLICVLVVIVAGLSICVYVHDYYHADSSVKEYLSGQKNGVTVSYGPDQEIIFHGQKNNNIGLIFYPGGKVEYTSYAPLMNLLATKGITCFLVHMPFNLAIMDIDAAKSIRERHPEISHWYIGGHSLGGVSAAMFLNDQESQFDGLILLGAYSSKDLSEKKIPVLSIYGENDGIMNRKKYDKYKKILWLISLSMLFMVAVILGLALMESKKGMEMQRSVLPGSRR